MGNTKKFNPYTHEPKKEVSWTAIFAGTLTVMAILLILNLIGLAVGLGSIDPTEEANPLSGIGTGGLIWWVVSNLIALFAGGFVAARVGVSFTDIGGLVQGIMTWGLYTILSAWLLTTVVGTVISGVGSVVGGVITTTGDAFAPAIERQFEDLDISMEEGREEIHSLLRDAGIDPDELQSDLQNEILQGLRDGDVEQAFNNARDRLARAFDEVDRDELVNILVERTDMSQNEAEEAVDNVLADLESLRQDVDEFLNEAEQEAREQAEKAADAGAKAAGYLAVALILGLFTAALGGIMGVRNLRDEYEAHYVHPPENDPHVHSGPHPSERPGPTDEPGR